MEQAIEKLHGVRKQDWISYEELRRSGSMNMWGARPYLGLTRDEFAAIISHYGEMRAAWDKDVPTREQ